MEVCSGCATLASNFKADPSLEFGLLCHVLVDGGRAWLLAVWGWCDKNSTMAAVLVLWLWAWTCGCTDSLISWACIWAWTRTLGPCLLAFYFHVLVYFDFLSFVVFWLLISPYQLWLGLSDFSLHTPSKTVDR